MNGHLQQKIFPLNTVEFFDKLKTCLLEIFQSSLLKEGKRAQGLLVESAFNNIFGRKDEQMTAKQPTECISDAQESLLQKKHSQMEC
jgi:hypothetical protein